MADPDGVLLSVRGEAQWMVAPDAVDLTGSLSFTRGSKPRALAAAAAATDRLTAELSLLGGVARSLGTERSALTWSAFSVTTLAERRYDKKTGRFLLTGQIAATVHFEITVRDFGILEDLGALVARHEDLHVRDVFWYVDEDNPGWAAVRAEAVQAALRRGRDYAAALGTSLVSVEQVADRGLLSESGGGRQSGRAIVAALSAGGDGDQAEQDTPSLDPVPQLVHAVVEARLRATTADLVAHLASTGGESAYG